MIKIRAQTVEGRRVLIFGLSHANVLRLQKGQPIIINLADMGLPAEEGEIVIMAGPTEESMIEELRDYIGPGNHREPHEGQHRLMSTFAKDTKVEPSKSREEIERTLERYGATGFMYANKPEAAAVAFQIADRHVRFMVPLPLLGECNSEAHHKRRLRQRWRALALVIKSKLEAVESEIVTFDEEFMAHIVMPDGNLVGDMVKPRIESAYKTGKMPDLLPGYKGDGV